MIGVFLSRFSYCGVLVLALLLSFPTISRADITLTGAVQNTGTGTSLSVSMIANTGSKARTYCTTLESTSGSTITSVFDSQNNVFVRQDVRISPNSTRTFSLWELNPAVATTTTTITVNRTSSGNALAFNCITVSPIQQIETVFLDVISSGTEISHNFTTSLTGSAFFRPATSPIQANAGQNLACVLYAAGVGGNCTFLSTDPLTRTGDRFTATITATSTITNGNLYGFYLDEYQSENIRLPAAIGVLQNATQDTSSTLLYMFAAIALILGFLIGPYIINKLIHIANKSGRRVVGNRHRM